MKKKSLGILFACFAIAGQITAQSFEGVIKWKMSMDMPGVNGSAGMSKEDAAKVNEGMSEAQKAMAEKMKDPEFRKQMEQNPQMKAMMEQAMQNMNNGASTAKSGPQGMMPTGMTIKIKGGNSLTSIEGGMAAAMMGDILYLKDKDMAYSLKKDKKTFSALPKSPNSPKTQGEATATKTTETATILNYKCTKYIVETTEMGRKNTIFLWTTTDIKDLDRSIFEKMKAGRGNVSFPSNVEGIPLKIEVAMQEGKMVMEVIDIKKQTIDATEFAIPADFKETKGFGGN